MDLSVKVKVGRKEYEILDVLMVIGLIAVGVLIRFSLVSYESGDWLTFLEPWTNQLKEKGFKALQVGYYNYTPLYMYVLWFLTILPIDTLLGIKMVSAFFDVVLAAAVAAVVKEVKPGCNPMLPFGIVWLAPVVISNSSMWGQCDAIYTAFVILCLLYLLRGKSTKALFFYGIAFAIKLQSIFFAPMLVFLFFLRKIRFRDFFLIPIVYLVSIIPAWIAGRPFRELLLIYFGQTQGQEQTLSVIYPNVYYLIGNDVFLQLYGRTAIWFTMGVLLVFMYYVLKKLQKQELSAEILVLTALIAGSVIVFLLPNMRERYSYLVDILSVIYAFINVKKLYVPLIRMTISYMAYTTYYRFGMFTSYELLAVLQVFLLIDLVYTLYNTLHVKKCNSSRNEYICLKRES